MCTLHPQCEFSEVTTPRPNVQYLQSRSLTSSSSASKEALACVPYPMRLDGVLLVCRELPHVLVAAVHEQLLERDQSQLILADA
eukprot:6750070-Prymnesium_polylepis.1